MGFRDKAKKMAEQAQQKLDEVQRQFNENQAQTPAGDPSGDGYDEQGRPVAADSPPAADPAVAQGVGQPQPPEATDPLAEPERAREQPTAEKSPAARPSSAEQPASSGAANANPDPFKPLE